MSKYTDAERIEFMADPNQLICNVQLPTDIVESNIHSLRDAIDETIGRYKEGLSDEKETNTKPGSPT